MSTSIIAKDLTKQAPASPRQRVGGFVIAARTIDKCRASMDGKLGSYHYDCPLDNVLFGFKGVKGDQFKEAVKAAKSYEDVGEWLKKNGTPKTDAEIKEWSDKVEANSIYNDPAKREYFVTECKKLGLDPAKTTTFEWLDTDDKAEFKGK